MASDGDVGPAVPANAEVVMDRFVSASSSQDAVESLESMIAGFKDENEPWQTSWIWKHEALSEHLVYLLQHGSLQNGDLPCEEGVTLVCQLYQQFLAKKTADATKALQQPAPGRLLEALLDVMDHADRPLYTRVLSLQVLELLSSPALSSLANSQWLQAPNGLHRLADLLTLGQENPMEEMVRNQALLVANLLARHAPMAKVFLFAEVEVKLLDVCWQQQGGLTKGNPIVLDALRLIQELAQHADGPLQDLIWQRPTVAPRLAQLLDLRGGDQFLHPQEYTKAKQVKESTKTVTTKADKEDTEDDLDDLLQIGGAKPSTKAKEEPKEDDATKKEEEKEEVHMPRLLDAEEQVVQLVLNILDLLLESEPLRPTVWSQHKGLCSLVWELALINPTNPPVCALPSPKLQQRALELVATKLGDPTTMDRHHGLDRLLYLICTGGGASSLDQRFGLSQAALAVLRQVLDGDRIHEMLLHTLAPPPQMEDDDEGNVSHPPPGPTVVQKLWNTVAENLAPTDEALLKSDGRTLFVTGALGALGVLCCDAESREMILKVTPPPASIEHMLEVLDNNPDTSPISWSLLRFLCEWIFASPALVQELLSSTASTHLASMAAETKRSTAPLVYLLLGLSMEYFPQQVHDCGGWTPDSVLELLQTIGISKVTASLESLKKAPKKDTQPRDLLPWSLCQLEQKQWSDWYQKAVWMVRKRVVSQIAGGTTPGDETDDSESQGHDESDTGGAVAAPAAIKPLQKLIAQQTTELEDLRLQLEKAQAKIASQDSQLSTWKRRTESNPTELDAMLNELTTKTASYEEELQTMKAETKQMQAHHAAEVEKHETKAKDQEAQIQQLTEKVEEQRQECSRYETSGRELREELESLRQAHTSLEQQHEALIAQPAREEAVTAGGTPTGEGGQQGVVEQSQGEASNQQGGENTEVSTLRAENARLRQDARAADEWMAMAVQRMNEMGALTAQLQSQGGVESENLSEEDKDQQLHSLQQERTVLQSNLDGLNRELGEVRQQLESVEASKAAEIESSIASVKEDWDRSQQQLVAEKEDLQRNLDEVAATKMLGADQSDESLREELAAKNAEIEALSKSLESAQQAQPSAMQGEPSTSTPAIEADDQQESSTSTPAIEADDQQVDSARKEVEDLRMQSEQDLYQREARIRELEDRLNSDLGSYKVEDIRERDEEIEELRSANEAAQEWMGKAVEHNQVLQEQVSTLTNENSMLTAQVNQYKGQVTPSQVNEAAVKLLEGQLQDQGNQLEEVRLQLVQREEELKQVREEFEANQSTQMDLGIAREDVHILQKQLEEARSRALAMESKLDDTAMVGEIDMLKATNVDLEKQLEEFQSWADMVQARIAEILAAQQTTNQEVAAAKEELRAKDAEIERLQGEVDKLALVQSEQATRQTDEDEVEALQKKMRAKEAEIERLQEEVDELTRVQSEHATKQTDEGEVEVLKKNVTSLEDTNVELSKERDDLKRSNSQLESDLQELMTWTEGVQPRLEQLVDAKAQVEAKLKEEQFTSEELRTELQNLQRTIVESTEHAQSLEVSEEPSTTPSNEVGDSGQVETATPAPGPVTQSEHEPDTKEPSTMSESKEMVDDSVPPAAPVQPLAPGASSASSNDAEDFFGGVVPSSEETGHVPLSTLSDAVPATTGVSDDSPGGAEYILGSVEEPAEKTAIAPTDPVTRGVSTASSSDAEDFFAGAATPSAEVEDIPTFAPSHTVPMARGVSATSSSDAEDFFGGGGATGVPEPGPSHVESMDRVVSAASSSDAEDFFGGNASTTPQPEAEERGHDLHQDSAPVEALVRGISAASSSAAEDFFGPNPILSGQVAEKHKDDAMGQVLQEEPTVHDAAVSTDVVSELEAETLETSIHEHEEDTELSSSQWQEKYSNVVKKCDELQQELGTLRQSMEDSDQVAEAKSSLDAHISSLEDAIDVELDEVKGMGSEQGTHEDVETLKEQLRVAQQALQLDEDAVQRWEDRVAELEATKQSVEQQLQDQEMVASDAIAQWQESYAISDKKVTELEDELRASREAMPEGTDGTGLWEAQVKGLEDRVEALQGQLDEAQSQSEEVVHQWEERVQELESEVDSLQAQLQEAMSSGDNVVHQWEERVGELETEIESLQSQLLKESATQEEAIALKEAVQEDDENGSQSETEAHAEEDKKKLKKTVSELESMTMSLRSQLQDAQSESEEVVRQWEERVDELEEEVDSLQSQLQEAVSSGNDVVRQWEERVAELEGEMQRSQSQHTERDLDGLGGKPQSRQEFTKDVNCEEEDTGSRSVESLLAKVTELENEIGGLQSNLQEAQSNSEEVVHQWEERTEELESEVDTLQTQLQDAVSSGEDVVHQWEERVAELEGEIDSLQSRLQEEEMSRAAQELTALADEESLKLIQELSAARAEKDALQKALGGMEDDMKKLEGVNASLESQITGTRGGDVMEALELERLVQAKEEELQAANQALAQDEQVVKQWGETVAELEAEIETLKDQIHDQEQEAEEVINQWQETSTELEERCGSLEHDLKSTMEQSKEERTSHLEAMEQLKKDHELLNEAKQTLEASLERTNKEKVVLEEQVAILETNVCTQKATAEELQGKLQAEDVALVELQQAVSQDERIVKQWEERVAELESTVMELNVQLEEQGEEADAAIQQWHESNSGLEAKVDELTASLENAQEELTHTVQKMADRDWTIEQLQSEVDKSRNHVDLVNASASEKSRLEEELADEKARHAAARDEIHVLEKGLEALRHESDDVVGQWTERVEELEGINTDIQTQLASQEEDANLAISSWETKAEDLERELENLTTDLKEAHVDLESSRQKVSDQEMKLQRLESMAEELQFRVDNLESELKSSKTRVGELNHELGVLTETNRHLVDLEEDLKKSQAEADQELDLIRSERDRLKDLLASKSREMLEEERDRLTVVVAQLEEELNEANGMVQSYITDGSSDKAATAAAQALRDEVETLRTQIDDFQRQATDERATREVAEAEVARLRDDVVALAAMNEHDSSSEQIQQRTAKAVERLKMKERIEIEQLRKSLYRAIEELEVSRSAEQSSSEELSKARLQATVGEQEVVAAKNDVQFLTRELDELRMAEESKRISLEYRIGSLEDENDVLRRYHSSELESVRNELAQMAMEKDRTFHQLKESEKTNSALVMASSKVTSAEVGDVDDLESEISKLRIENSHLLTVAADDKARAERRLREVLAAHRATAEADTILEHELRVSAEETLQSLKAELDELRASNRQVQTSEDKTRHVHEATAATLTLEVEALTVELQKLRKDNGGLKKKLEHALARSRSDHDSLTEELRKAQAKVHTLEREGKFDAAVQLEVTKLRDSPEKRQPTNTEDDWLVVGNNSTTLSAEAFDLIRQQKEEIMEERKMYQEFLEEHDSLLALLAQHDLERSCLKEALSESAGEDALQEVLEAAESKAMEQFGTVIRVA